MGRREADEEFVRFVEQSTSTLRGTAWFLTGNADEAHDLLQSAYLRTYKVWGRVRHDDASAYARKIMANLAIDRWRRRRETPSDLSWRGDATDPHEVTHQRDQLLRLLDSLPPRQRAVVVLRFYNDLSIKDVADELNISEGSVKAAASRGLAALRSLTQDQEIYHD